ncbi:MAG: hypothetical protein U0893_09825 [Chloroflexota bacterium]
MSLLRWIVPVVAASIVLVAGGAPAPAEAMPFPPSRIGNSADYQGFINGRFLILNMHGGFMHRSIDPVQENIKYAAWMNAGAIRIFATDSSQSSMADADWLGNRIADVAPSLRAYDVKLIVALVNNHEGVPGESKDSEGWKDGYWQHLLPFFTGNWKGPYLEFSRRIISTVLNRGARDVILAWEYGNELNTQDDPPVVLDFMEQMHAEIRKIDPVTPIWPGTMGSHHLTPAYDYTLARRLYCEGPIDAYTLHTYDWLDSNRPGDMPIDRDLNYVVSQPCANGRRLPVVVEELGTSRELPGQYGPDDEQARLAQEILQINMVLGYDQVVGIGSWSSESPLTPITRHDSRRGLTSWGPGRSGDGSCYNGGNGMRCRLETILRSLPERPSAGT